MITIEQIDEFRKRTHSSYEDAKYFLEKNNGDILDAIIEFERTKSGSHKNTQHKKQQNDFGKGFSDILQKGFDTRIVVEDKGSTLFTIPVILLILLIPIWVFAFLFFALLVMLGYKVSIKDIKNENVNVHNIFQNINDKMKETNVNKEKSNSHGYKKDVTEGASDKQESSGGVPIKSNINIPVNTETSKPEKDQDKEDGYNEYTIE